MPSNDLITLLTNNFKVSNKILWLLELSKWDGKAFSCLQFWAFMEDLVWQGKFVENNRKYWYYYWTKIDDFSVLSFTTVSILRVCCKALFCFILLSWRFKVYCFMEILVRDSRVLFSFSTIFGFNSTFGFNTFFFTVQINLFGLKTKFG